MRTARTAVPTVNQPAEPFAPIIIPTPLILGGLPDGDSQAIVGRWILRADDLVYLWIFNANGTCKDGFFSLGQVTKLP